MNITIDPSKTLERPIDPTLSLLDFALDDQAIRDSGHDPAEVYARLDEEFRRNKATRLAPGVYQPAPGMQEETDMLGVIIGSLLLYAWLRHSMAYATFFEQGADAPQNLVAMTEGIRQRK